MAIDGKQFDGNILSEEYLPYSTSYTIGYYNGTNKQGVFLKSGIGNTKYEVKLCDGFEKLRHEPEDNYHPIPQQMNINIVAL